MMESDGEREVLIVDPEDEDGYKSCDDNPNDGETRTLTVDEAIETAGFGKFHFLMAMVLGWANSADAVEMLSISFVLPYASCELKATDLELGFLTAVGFAGMMIGSYFWGGVSDVIGRIKALVLCQAINGLFIIGSALSQSLTFLILMRLLSGFGVGGTNPLIFVYAVEVMPLKQRGRMTGVLSCFFMVGQVMVAGMAWFIIPHVSWTWTTHGFTFNSWRIFMLVSSLPVVSSFFMFMAFPESPRYLMRVNKMAEAKAAMRKIYRRNGYTKPYDDNYSIAKHEGPSIQYGVWGTLKEVGRNTWNLVAFPEIRGRFLLSSAVLFCLSFSYYGLTMWFPTLINRMESSNATSVCSENLTVTNQSRCDMSHQNEVYFVTFLQAASSLPGNIFYLIAIDTIGRRLLTGSSMVLTAISVFFIWLISNHTGSIIIACVFAGLTVVSWNALALLTAEIFPTELRSTARGVQSALFNRVAAIIASVVFGALIATHCAVPILLIAVLLVAGGLLTWTLPDTTKVAIG